MKYKNIAFRIDNGLYERLDTLAKNTGRKKTFYFEECLRAHLPVCESVYMHQKEVEEDRKKKIENAIYKKKQKL